MNEQATKQPILSVTVDDVEYGIEEMTDWGFVYTRTSDRAVLGHVSTNIGTGVREDIYYAVAYLSEKFVSFATDPYFTRELSFDHNPVDSFDHAMVVGHLLGMFAVYRDYVACQRESRDHFESYFCEVCGSSDVISNASISWNRVQQQWTILAREKDLCESCGYCDVSTDDFSGLS